MRLQKYHDDKHGILDDYIDVYFIANRTECINQLIYYPFLIIALMIIGRSTVFANFPLSLPIIIIQGGGLLIVASCAFALNWAAENARKLTQRHLSEEIIRAKGTSDSVGQWEALLEHVKSID